MRGPGAACLLVALAGSGYAAFAALAAARTGSRPLRRAAAGAGAVAVAALSLALVLLAHALYTDDFRLRYVGDYSSRGLPRSFALAALWVGQAGSLLLWAWMLGAIAIAFRLRSARLERDGADPTAGEAAYGLLMAYLGFLVATLVFAADPFEPAAAPAADGQGLSPLLQHPKMLIHPPVVFLGYAGWAVPCALLLAGLMAGRIDAGLRGRIRAWSVFAWAVLGVGIVLGAQWSYEELGWGGYWAWDPVENASLVPWLTGTALIHALAAWRARGVLKRTAAALAVATFALCNLATFLTRSGIFSSLHAFSRSPIGWLFLAMMAALALAGLVLLARRWGSLAPERPLPSALGAEALVAVSALALVLLAGLVTAGTLWAAISEPILGRRVVIGPEFYNNALLGAGLVLLGALAPSPLLSWGAAPTAGRRRALGMVGIVAIAGALAAVAAGRLHPLTAALVGVGAGALAALAARVILDADRRRPAPLGARLAGALRDGRRPYAGFLAHLGVCLLAIGVAGSSLGTRRAEFDLDAGASVRWEGSTVRFARLTRTERPDKLVVHADLEITGPRSGRLVLRPAQHYHRHQRLWTTEAAIARRWGGDLYAVVHHGEGDRARFSLRSNPLMRLLWLGGWTMAAAAALALLPDRRARRRAAPAPHVAAATRTRPQAGASRPCRHAKP
jgi:cytochrome c-type biogenesis protein CcmF